MKCAVLVMSDFLVPEWKTVSVEVRSGCGRG